MIEAIVAVVGAGAAVFLFQFFTKASVDRNQVKLEDKVKELESKADRIEGAIEEREKKTKEEVDAITKEQEKPITSDALADWFNNRKGR